MRLVRLAAERPWHDAAGRVARLVFDDDVVALIGPTDATTAHVAAQVATVGRIPLVTLSPEDSLTQVFDPWIFRGVPSDREQARAVLRWGFHDPRGRKVTLVVPAGRAGRERTASLRSACAELGVEVRSTVTVTATGEADGSAAGAEVLMLWLDPAPALRWLERVGGAGRPRRVLASTRLDSPQILDRLPDGVTELALPSLRSGASIGSESTGPAALGYDMVSAIVNAARRGGFTPAAIRSELQQRVSVTGRSGTFRFDQRGNRVGEIPVGIVSPGQSSTVRLPQRTASHGRPTS